MERKRDRQKQRETDKRDGAKKHFQRVPTIPQERVPIKRHKNRIPDAIVEERVPKIPDERVSYYTRRART